MPVTVKTRLGWDCEKLIITDLAEQLQDCGIQALTIHGCTRIIQIITHLLENPWPSEGGSANHHRIYADEGISATSVNNCKPLYSSSRYRISVTAAFENSVLIFLREVI